MFSALNSERRITTVNNSPPSNVEAADPALVSGAFKYVLRHTEQAYFFANQISLLELAMLKDPSQPADAVNYAIDLAHWGNVRTKYGGSMPQVVAWSDADDLLSWQVPDMENVKVINLHPRNAFRWFGLFEDPTAAHDKYASNKTVIKVLMCPKQGPHKDNCGREQ